ncbi:MAG: RNA pyrophosphohydrolase [Proteobacteria bacterium]|nr:RNA pyrophosphohydrolase [Pseudomonadota bacterium]
MSLYRDCVGIVLINKELKVFAGKRIDCAEAWQMPQGGIESNEDLRSAAFREMKEEIGISRESVEVLMESSWYTYDLPHHLRGTVWGGKYVGQKQKWFLMRFLDKDSLININTTEIPEFKEWCWMHANELIDSIVFFKRDIYKKVFEEFGSNYFA